MSRRITIIAFLFFGVLLIVGVIFTSLQKMRLTANLAGSKNNLRELALFAHAYANPDPKIDAAAIPRVIPPGTIVLPGVPPENRLSWPVPLIPVLNQKRQDLATLFSQIDQTQPWLAEVNQTAGRTPLLVLVCPGTTPKPAPDAGAITSYVGIAGLAPPDPATIALPVGMSPSPRAGAFRYDAPTPLERIRDEDGLSQTLMMGETANEPGPWLRGGYSTIRGLNDSRDAKPLIGEGGQYGGFFPNGAHFALCDGGVRMFTPQTTPSVLLRMAAIADGKIEVSAD